MPRLADDLTDTEIDAALERMAWLLGQDFVESCEAEIIKERPVTTALFTKQKRIVRGEEDNGE